MGEGDLPGEVQKGDVSIATQRVLSPYDGLPTVDGVLLHLLELLGSQPPRLEEDAVRDPHLADIV